MCNSCIGSLASALNNLFGSPCGCNQNNYSLASTVNNLFGEGSGCGCGWNNFSNGFVSGVNAANAANGNNHGNGNSGCGCNHGNSGCGNNQNYGYGGGFDPYYARQYALGPYAQNGCGCSYNF